MVNVSKGEFSTSNKRGDEMCYVRIHHNDPELSHLNPKIVTVPRKLGLKNGSSIM